MLRGGQASMRGGLIGFDPVPLATSNVQVRLTGQSKKCLPDVLDGIVSNP